MVSNRGPMHACGRALLTVAGAMGVVAVMKIGSILRDTVVVLSPLDEIAY